MSKKQTIVLFVFMAILLSLCAIILKQVTKKVDYIEYVTTSEECSSALEINNNNCIIKQEIHSPYEVLYGFSFLVGTYDRNNNSRYELVVEDNTIGKPLCSKRFETTNVIINGPIEIMLDKPILMDHTHKYSITIKPISKINVDNGIAFFVNEVADYEGTLFYGDIPVNSTLCMNIYGGNSSNFYFRITLFCLIYVVALSTYVVYLTMCKKSIKSNSIVQIALVGMVVFLLFCGVAKIYNFADETDNMAGGMLIAQGRVMYRDYYSQHTPFMYWLCALFAKLGADAMLHFRLLFYLLIAIIDMGLYARHKDNFGKVKMILIPIVQILIGLVVDRRTMYVLSDTMQAVCMVALTLEFLQYLKDKKLDWKRSVIVSLSIFVSIACAFVSVYAIFAIGLGVFINEIMYWKENKQLSFKNIIARYWKLVIACAIPFAFAFTYFVATHSLTEFYEQAFKFNTDVYPIYSGIGSNMIQPFIKGIGNLFSAIPASITRIFSANSIVLSVLILILMIALFVILLKFVANKKYLKAVTLFLLISFSFCRLFADWSNINFHAFPGWSIIITIIILYSDMLKTKNINIYRLIVIVLGIILLGTYFSEVNTFLFEKQKPISKDDHKIITETAEGDMIFLDLFSNNSIYSIYKNRKIVNRLMWVFPWYMQWYELDVVEDIQQKEPKIVVFDSTLTVGENDYFSDYLKKHIEENYEPIDGYNMLWKRKDL